MTAIYELSEWVRATQGSTALRESVWAYPVVQITHVIAVLIFFGLVFLLDARVIGLAMRHSIVSEVYQRLFAFTMMAFALATVTGMLLLYSDPVAMYENVVFRIKILLLALAGVNMAVFHLTIFRTVGEWGKNLAAVPRQAIVGASLSLCLWSAIIFSGRFIAFSWIFD